MAAIGDEDSITGLLLAGIGHIDSHQKKNFLVVDASTFPSFSSRLPSFDFRAIECLTSSLFTRHTFGPFYLTIHLNSLLVHHIRNATVCCRGSLPRVLQTQGHRYHLDQPTRKGTSPRSQISARLLSSLNGLSLSDPCNLTHTFVSGI